MMYKNNLEPAVNTENKDTVPQAEQMQNFRGPDETWQGEVVDMNYSVVPEEKDAIQANLRKAGEDVVRRFGLDQRGVDPEPYPNKD